MARRSLVLVVDDSATNRLTLSHAVKKLVNEVETAENGRIALERLQHEAFDLVLLDINMPEIDGFEVLRRMQSNPALQGVPVIVVSAVDEMESVVACIELGAEDHLPKPFDATLFKARIDASLEKKRLRDALQEQMEFAEEAFGKYVPDSVAAAVLENRGLVEPIRREATILHTDIEGFTTIVEANTPQRVFQMINEYFDVALEEVGRCGGVVTKFQGDSMQVTFNGPVLDEHHADSAVKTALALQNAIQDRDFAGIRLRTRIGICTGELIAGTVGSKDRWNYTVLGDCANTAARLEKLNKDYGTWVLVSGPTIDQLTGTYPLEPAGEVAVRGRSAPIRVSSLRVGSN